MRIVADENIPLVQEFFSSLGDVKTLPGRSMTAKDVDDADVLLVRSVTTVDSELLAGSRVKFVGTCTIGVDHLDLDFLTRRNIAYASAPGCNANSVVEYIFSVFSALNLDWQNKTVGIVGCGNVGGRLYRRLRTLGVNCRCYDPFLEQSSERAAEIGDLCDLISVLKSDVISLHTPLTHTGPYPSYHMIGKHELSKIAAGSLLINTGRGAVIDNQALLDSLQQCHDIQVVLDVWEPEPALNPELLNLMSLGTPHIAGYSYDGKVAGTEMIYQALCRYLKRSISLTRDVLLDGDSVETLRFDGTQRTEHSTQSLVQEIILRAYDVRADDFRLRQAVDSDLPLADEFDRLRKTYPVRREFSHYAVEKLADKQIGQETLEKLGFLL